MKLYPIDRQESNTTRFAAADHSFAVVPAAACGGIRAAVPAAAKRNTPIPNP